MSPNIFNDVHHICIVVEDMDRSVAFYESVGVGPWHDFPSLEAFRDGLLAPDVDDFTRLHYRFAALGNVQLQLCAPPPGNTPQRRFLEERGEGVFHIGFTAPELDATEDVAREAGLDLKLRGRTSSGAGFTYFDTSDRGAGVTLQIRRAAT